VSERRLVLVRHGVTDWNREGRFQGHLDSPLSDSGRFEARLAAARIAGDDGMRPARIVSSTLGRALETALAIGEAAHRPVAPDARLIEIGQGDWEGRTHAELEAAEPERYAAWRAAAGIRQPPGGEPIEEADRRVRELLDELARDAAWPTCLVSHGGTLRLIAHAVLDLDRSWSRALDVDNASISVVAGMGDAWRLERWNDSLHLLGREQTHVDEVEGRPLAL
jgi:glucosyl-3-phosphoglycerate phosphatase